MSQFLIGVGPPPPLPAPVCALAIARAPDHVQRAAQDVLGPAWKDAWQLVDGTGDTCSELFDTFPTPFRASVVHAVLSALCSEGCRLYAWYGTDWADLLVHRDPTAFIADVERQIDHEVYAAYVPHAPGAA